MIDLEIPDAEIFLLDYTGPGSFDELRHGIHWQQRKLTIAGRRINQPRLTAWYGDKAYRYSGLDNHPQAWNPLLSAIRGEIQALLGVEFNSVLLNLYRDGQDSISPHSDDERELGEEPIIASLSFGAPRVFTFQPRRGDYPDHHVDLIDGSLLVMSGSTQKNWRHGIAKVKSAGPRINLTFRRIIG